MASADTGVECEILSMLAAHPRLESRPLVTATYAQTIDGSIAAPDRRPIPLSGPQSMRLTHRLRSAHDAILIGVSTLVQDNPQLNVRLCDGPSPRVLIMDPHLRSPPSARIFAAKIPAGPPIIFHSAAADEDRARVLRNKNAVLVPLATDPQSCNKLSFSAMYAHLHTHFPAIKRLMIEGGGAVLRSVLSGRHFDVAIVTIAPVYYAGYHLACADSARPPAEEYCHAPRLCKTSVRMLGDDIVLVGWAASVPS